MNGEWAERIDLNEVNISVACVTLTGRVLRDSQ